MASIASTDHSDPFGRDRGPVTQESHEVSIATRVGQGHCLQVRAPVLPREGRDGLATTELWRELSSSGFIGVNIPAEYGGGGAGISELAIVCEELGAAGCPRSMLIVSIAICAELLVEFGSARPAEGDVAAEDGRGDAELAFSITEPDAGLNTHALDDRGSRR